MKRYLLTVAASVLGLALVLSPSANVQAAELRLLAGGAMSGVWADIKPQFEQASGHRLEIFFGTTPNIIKEATSGKPFDVGVVPVEVMQDASARAKFVASPTIDIAHVGLGVAVRSGAQKPEIGNADALSTVATTVAAKIPAIASLFIWRPLPSCRRPTCTADLPVAMS